MSHKRYALAAPVDTEESAQFGTLPIDRPVAIYYRQSTEDQIGNVSTYQQTEDLPKYAESLGWDADKIILIDADQGYSGKLRIDERPGATELYSLIIDGKIGAILVINEDRLARDSTQIEANKLIEACRQNRVMIITPMMRYSFHDRIMGAFNIKMFRAKMEASADYIDQYIIGRLASARKHKREKGAWVSGNIPTGFLISDDKRKLIAPWPDAVPVLIRWWQIFIEENGSLATTAYRIAGDRVFLPDHTDPAVLSRIPAGYVLQPHYLLKPNKAPHRDTLRDMFTNAVYAGHFLIGGRVAIRDHHDPLIPHDLFDKAFRLASPVLFDGTPNPDYKPRRNYRKPDREAQQGIDRPLFEGYLFAEDKRINVCWSSESKGWLYYELIHPDDGVKKALWSRRANLIDEIIEGHIREALTHKRTHKELEKLTDRDVVADLAKQKNLLAKQRESVQKQADGIVDKIASLSTPQLIGELEKRYTQHISELGRIDAKIAQFDLDIENADQAKEAIKQVGYYAKNWDRLPRNHKLAAVRAFLLNVEVSLQDNGELELTIVWRGGATSRDVVESKPGAWLKSDVERILFMIDGGYSQPQICSLYPATKWDSISKLVYRIKGYYPKFSPQPIWYSETFEDWINRTTPNERASYFGVTTSGTPAFPLPLPDIRGDDVKRPIRCPVIDDLLGEFRATAG